MADARAQRHRSGQKTPDGERRIQRAPTALRNAFGDAGCRLTRPGPARVFAAVQLFTAYSDAVGSRSFLPATYVRRHSDTIFGTRLRKSRRSVILHAHRATHDRSAAKRWRSVHRGETALRAQRSAAT